MQFDRLRRREFISMLGGAAAWALGARAQQPAMPVIGLLAGASPNAYSVATAPFLQGLKETGYVERQNVAIDAGRRITTIAYLDSRPTWFIVRWQ